MLWTHRSPCAQDHQTWISLSLSNQPHKNANVWVQGHQNVHIGAVTRLYTYINTLFSAQQASVLCSSDVHPCGSPTFPVQNAVHKTISVLHTVAVYLHLLHTHTYTHTPTHRTLCARPSVWFLKMPCYSTNRLRTTYATEHQVWGHAQGVLQKFVWGNSVKWYLYARLACFWCIVSKITAQRTRGLLTRMYNGAGSERQTMWVLLSVQYRYVL